MSDQMRAEFDEWAKSRNLPTATIHWKDGSYSFTDERTAWAYEGYAAGRKAERAEVERLERDLYAAKFGRTSRKQKDKTPPAA